MSARERATTLPPADPRTAGDDAFLATGTGFIAPPSAARDLAVDLVKMFITFATAGIAFLIGAVFSGKIVLSAATVIGCLVLFAASATCGIAFIMHAVSGVYEGRHDVTAPLPASISAMQMLLFFIGAGLLGWQAIERAGTPMAQPATTQIDIHATAGRWSVDSGAGIAIHKERAARDVGSASLRVRATSDGLTLRIELDTVGTRAVGATTVRPR